MRALNFHLLFAPLFALLFCFNQTAAQAISGVVTDEKNAAVINAEVTLTKNNAVISSTLTDSEGKFVLSDNNQRSLLLRVKATGFALYERQLESNSQTPLSIILLLQNPREEVTVTITRTETRLGETPASIIVLNRETLETSATHTIDDALRQVPGFSLFRRTSSRTANPTAQGANLRGVSGSGASRTAVLLDGISLNDAFGGWTYWTRIPRAAVAQVEVLRGGASALYGTAALSGAINVVTQQTENDKPVLRLETSVGTQKTVDGSLFTAYGRRNWSVNLAAESFQTGGYIPVDEQKRGSVDARANSRHNSLFLTAERQFEENSRFFVRGNLFAERRDNGTILQKNRTQFRQFSIGGDLKDAKFGTFILRSFIETQIYDQNFSSISANRNLETLTRLQRVPSQAAGGSVFWSRPFSTHTLSAGSDARQVRGFSDEIIYGGNQATSTIGAGGREFTIGVFIQDFWRINSKLNLNFGGRFDRWHESDALSTTQNLTGNRNTTVVNFPKRSESSFSPQISAIYQINNNFSFTASFNRSFRAPTLNEFYRAFRVGNVLTLANSDLRAERAKNAEAGFNYNGFGRLSLRGTVFWTKVSRPIVNVTLSAAPNLITRQRQNLGATRSRGIELDSELRISRNLTFSAGYLFADARILDFSANASLAGRFLPQVARHQFTFQTSYRKSRFSFGIQGRAVGSQFEDDQNELQLRPYFALDALAAYQFRHNLEFFIAGENLTNSRYDIGKTPVKTIAPPSFARVGLRFSLGRK